MKEIKARSGGDRSDMTLSTTITNYREKDLDKIIEEGFERNKQLFDKLENQKKLISKF